MTKEPRDYTTLFLFRKKKTCAKRKKQISSFGNAFLAKKRFYEVTLYEEKEIYE